jgi:hypothetical protein
VGIAAGEGDETKMVLELDMACDYCVAGSFWMDGLVPCLGFACTARRGYGLGRGPSSDRRAVGK